MEVRPYNQDSDLDDIKEWYAGHNAIMPPEEFFIANGQIALDGEDKYAAAWLYFAEAGGMAFIGWTVTNPNSNPKKRLRGTFYVVDFLVEFAKDQGYVPFAVTSTNSLAKLYGKVGLQTLDSNSKFMGGSL